MKDKSFYSTIIHFTCITFIIIISQINISSNTGCIQYASITDTTCFNDVLIFNNKRYRAGHFVTYKNGDMVVEFSCDGDSGSNHQARLFYGLKSDGRYYFPNNSPIYEIENIGGVGEAKGRYESLNLIVFTENDINRENEMLFSTSSYNSLTELHLIQNRTYTYAKSKTFLDKNIYSFQYSLVEAVSSSNIFYFIGFTYSDDDQSGNKLYIKKFGLKSFSLSDYNSYQTASIDYNKNCRILNLFVLSNFETLVLVYINNNDKLYFKFYDYDLNDKNKDIEVGSLAITNRDGIFFKSVELPDNKRAFSLYFDGKGEFLFFNIYEFSKSGDTYSKTEILSTSTPGDYWFSSYITFNDIYKINDNRIAVATVTTADTNYYVLVLLLYDLYNIS